MRLYRLLLPAALALLGSVPATATTGPYPAKLEANPRLPYHTLYRPVDLGRPSQEKLPVVVFAGGGCRNAGARFRSLLTEIASHGYFVIALGEVGDPDRDSNPDNEPDFGGRPTKTDISQIDYAIGWARAEATRPASPYRGRIDPSRLVVMGQSCGGVQSIDAATRHPELSGLVVLNSGTWPDDQSLGGSKVKQKDLGKIRMPALILLGGKGDVAYENGEGDYDRMVNAPIMVASADYGHRATYFDKDGGLYGRVVVDWLQWILRGDARSARTFSGTECGLCTDRKWTIRRRGLETIRPNGAGPQAAR